MGQIVMRCEFQKVWVALPHRLLIAAYMTFLLGWLCLLPMAFLGSCSTLLASQTYQGLNAIFALLVLLIALSEAPSLTSQAFI